MFDVIIKFKDLQPYTFENSDLNVSKIKDFDDNIDIAGAQLAGGGGGERGGGLPCPILKIEKCVRFFLFF